MRGATGNRGAGWALRALAGLGLGAALASAARAGVLVEQALQAGRLSGPEAAAYQLLERVDPDAVPTEYRQALEAMACGTPLAVAAHQARQGADPFAGRLLASALQRPSLGQQHLSPSGRFRLHYDTVGREAVDPADADANGVPDYVDLAAAIADSTWRLEIDALGYRPPPSDNGAGGGDEVDIYILDLGRSQNYGITYPTASGASGPSFFEVDNDFENAIYGNTFICPGHTGSRGAEALRVTIAHEFFHVVQFGHYQGSDGSWWQEASATWMEDVAYPEVNDYLQYVCSYILLPGRALDSGLPRSDFHAYGASVFAHFLAGRYGRDVVRWIWEEHGRRHSASLDNFDRALRDYQGDVLGVTDLADAGIETAFTELSVWNWFVGERFRPGFYAEGDAYPALLVSPFSVVAKAAVSDSGRVDHMATKYFRFEPRLLPGGATLDTELGRGRWRRRLLLVGADSVEVRDIGREGAVTVAGWDAYEDVVLVLAQVDVSGIGYDYRALVEYDPDLGDGPAPLAVALGSVMPNPFRPGVDGFTLIPFELAAATEVTRLSLYGVDGRLVRRFDLGPRAARRHAVRWDGTNEAGKNVGSGVYYAVLEADGVERRRPVAVIRDH